jgi:3-dehydroquinate synthase
LATFVSFMEKSHPILYGITSADELLNVVYPAGISKDRIFFLHDSGVPEADFSAWRGNWGVDKTLRLPGGESAKSLQSVSETWEFLMNAGADRHSVLIHVGGGAVCDAGGFAASCFKRGIDFIHVPTTLLAMVDASVGGKTGINFRGVKNVIGTFQMPKAVVIQPGFLVSLPERELLSGYAEMIKHGLISDSEHLDEVKYAFSTGKAPGMDLIRKSIEIKRKVVEADPKEEGVRATLNFGHTVGHALESLADGKLLHGEAVAAGMWVELKISEQLAGFPQEFTRHFALWAAPLWKRVEWSRFSGGEMLQKMLHDKKNRDGKMGMVLLKNPGCAVWNQTVDSDLFLRVWNELLQEADARTNH